MRFWIALLGFIAAAFAIALTLLPWNNDPGTCTIAMGIGAGMTLIGLYIGAVWEDRHDRRR